MTTKLRGALCALLLSPGLVLHVMATDIVAQQAAQPQPPPAPTGGYADPAGIPPRLRTPDIEPVYRGPSIDTLATIRQRGVLRVGVAAVEPMVMRDANGTLSGFSIDLATKLAEDLGVRVEFFETSWSQVVADVIDRFPNATLVPVEPDDHEMTTVVAGKAHAALVATFAPRAIVAHAPDTLVLPFADALQTTRTAMAIRKGDADFLNYLNSWLAFQRDEGWLDERIGRWAAQAAK